jgi:hypothetical protein
MPPERVRAIRKAVARSPRDFEARFGVPARTLEGWEQGRKLDAAHRVLLRVIEAAPEAVRGSARVRGAHSELCFWNSMRRILRKFAEGDVSNLGDTSTLADPGEVDVLLGGGVRGG